MRFGLAKSLNKVGQMLHIGEFINRRRVKVRMGAAVLGCAHPC